MVLVEIRPWTRLGNWLFQCAAGLALDENARAYVTHPSLVEKFRRYDNFFGRMEVVEGLPAGAVTYVQPRFGYDDIPEVAASTTMVISGFFQSAKFFQHQRARILEAYLPSAKQRERLEGIASEWINIPNVTAIHVRRGDYLGLQYMHPFVGKRYFRQAIARMPEAKAFVVFSDDMPWCRKFFPKAFPDRKFFFCEGNSAVDDLYLQSLCQNNIISNSSFSWWAAWLNEHLGKRVLAPSQWFGLVHDPEYWQDIYAEGWEVVPNGYSSLQYLLARWQQAVKLFKIWAVKLLRRGAAQ